VSSRVSPDLSRLMAWALVALATPALAHDDDPKILDYQAPYTGPGYRPGTWLGSARRAAAGEVVLGRRDSNPALSELDDSHLEYDSNGVELLAWLPLEELAAGALSGNDCWGYVSPGGREYALVGLSNGTTFVEVTQPSDPVVVDHVSGPNSLWRDVKVYGDHAYVVSEGGGGIQVIDLGAIDSGTVSLVNTITSGGVSSTHNVAIDEESGYLYRCGGANGTGLRIYSLANPANPVFVGSWNSRYVHDVQVVTYTSGPFSGREIAFACSGFGNGSGQTGLTILDVTNKGNVTVRAQFEYPGAAYSHQAWLSPDRQWLYLDDELDEDGVLPTTTFVIDVSDIDDPSLAGTFSNGNAAIGHNLYTQGDLLYEANYRSGLRLFDVSTPTAGTEVAYFDTYPGSDATRFNGLWSCYPYLPSGTVIGSDMERGLFVWWVGAPELELELLAADHELIDPAGASFDLRITEASPGDLQAGSGRLWYDAGAGIVEVPLVHQGGDLYEAPFPALDCASDVHWFLSARSSSGLEWRFPKHAPWNNLDSRVAVAEAVAFADDMEAPGGWTVGAAGDTANSGVWERAVPSGEIAAPPADRSPDGTMCWLTDNTGDVNGGRTTLVSPVFDLSSFEDPILDFWLWFERRGLNSPLDNCRIEVREGTGEWLLIERIEETPLNQTGSWRHMQYSLANWVGPNSEVQLRFRARDAELPTRVEVAIDDLVVRESLCDCATTNYCSASMNSAGTSAAMAATGSLSIAQNDFGLAVSGAVPGSLGLFFYGPVQISSPLGEGTLCVGGGTVGIQRLSPPVAADGSGAAARAVDFQALPSLPSEGGITAGSTWNFQFWYRDTMGGPAGSNLSDGLQASFCP